MIDFDLKSYQKKVLPTGDYVLRVVGQPELKSTKANNGSRYLEVKFKIVDGDNAGHYISKNFNLYNANETAERIAREHFCSLCDAASILNIQYYSQLENATLVGKIKETSYPVTDSQSGEIRQVRKNEIEYFNKYDGTVRIAQEELYAPPPHLNDDVPF